MAAPKTHAEIVAFMKSVGITVPEAQPKNNNGAKGGAAAPMIPRPYVRQPTKEEAQWMHHYRAARGAAAGAAYAESIMEKAPKSFQRGPGKSYRKSRRRHSIERKAGARGFLIPEGNESNEEPPMDYYGRRLNENEARIIPQPPRRSYASRFTPDGKLMPNHRPKRTKRTYPKSASRN